MNRTAVMTRRLPGAIILLFTLLTTARAGAQVFTDPAAAFASAGATHRQVLLVFQGSDWCIPCIKLEQQVLSSPRFLQFVQDSLVVLKADFPQRKKIAAGLVPQYEKLAEAFNPEGSFPKAVLLDAQQKSITPVTLTDTAPETFIAQIKALLRTYAAKM